MVRDQALVAAGKLDSTLGGPSVMPPQPEGIWQQAYSASKWKDAMGGDRFRRGLYTYWKRTSPYPGFIMFDAPTRDVCSARRLTTNTPLQALVTLNSEVYTELAEALAERCASDSDDLEEIVASMFLRVTSRQPAQIDVHSLLSLYHSVASEDTEEVSTVSSEAKDSDKAVVAETSQRSATDDSLSVDMRALAAVALAILNSDWALTK
jgi:hypothetical protein